ncbi:MAG: thymidine phosphorylase [Micrococcales bacterium]|nr:thymidine phosphorylase [Micrococcales bacterium]
MTVEPFSAVEVIAAKRDQRRLTKAQIDWVIDAYVRGVVAEEQMSALAMAICLNGLDTGELACWTEAMVETGEKMSFAGLGKVAVDKHSTGGVGDKITLPLAPLVASFGVCVPQLSGRGLGHTGGTLDKLEAIPGWRANLKAEEMMTQLGSVGAVICQAGPGLVPADQRLYALRDVTATIDSIPLIASSIMSKKIAAGADVLVLDVKCGSGAFMQDLVAARQLARTMVDLGQAAGILTTALVTDMSVPLGLTAGNALEVREAIEVLAGGGPKDVVELTLTLASEMLAGAGLDQADPAAALAGGQAMDTWRSMIRAQGGDPDAPLAWGREHEVVIAPADGVLSGLDARAVGMAAWHLGAGRTRRQDRVQAGAGVQLHAKPGDALVSGQKVATAWTDRPELLPRALEVLNAAITIDRVAKPTNPPAGANRPGREAASGLILDRVVF